MGFGSAGVVAVRGRNVPSNSGDGYGECGDGEHEREREQGVDYCLKDYVVAECVEVRGGLLGVFRTVLILCFRLS